MTPIRWLGACLPPRSAGRFLVVGAINTVVGFGSFPVLYLLLGARTGYLPIMIFCYVFNPLFSFATHKLISFESRQPLRIEGPRYIFYWGAIFAVNLGFLGLIADWNRTAFVAAQVGFTLVVVVLNYLVADRFVFARGESGRLGARD